LKGADFDAGGMERAIAQAAIAAGRDILSAKVDRSSVATKADGSPVTQADLRAERIIRERLGAAAPDLLVIGEEGGLPEGDQPLPEIFVLVDPLDGTRDYLAGSLEYTVNIALVERERAVIGVIYAPALGRLFVGSPAGAWEMTVDASGGPNADLATLPRNPIHVRRVSEDGPLALESRSHPDPATERALAMLQPAARGAIGSSLKFALIAAGEADLYPRGVRLNEWDIAAGDAVLTAAGGAVLTFEGEPLRYGQLARAMKVPPFVAIGDCKLRQRLARLRR
jgi:3'(2'), 5'-bisphosphate nucleotidase